MLHQCGIELIIHIHTTTNPPHAMEGRGSSSSNSSSKMKVDQTRNVYSTSASHTDDELCHSLFTSIVPSEFSRQQKQLQSDTLSDVSFGRSTTRNDKKRMQDSASSQSRVGNRATCNNAVFRVSYHTTQYLPQSLNSSVSLNAPSPSMSTLASNGRPKKPPVTIGQDFLTEAVQTRNCKSAETKQESESEGNKNNIRANSGWTARNRNQAKARVTNHFDSHRQDNQYQHCCSSHTARILTQFRFHKVTGRQQGVHSLTLKNKRSTSSERHHAIDRDVQQRWKI